MPSAFLRWIATRVPSCCGRTVPLKRTRWPLRGVLSATFRPTSGATATGVSALVAGGVVAAVARNTELLAGRWVNV